MSRQNPVRVGQRFGRLEVLEIRTESKGSRQRVFCLCLCLCGNHKVVRMDHLKSGATQSCGCHQREIVSATVGAMNPNFKHGHGRKNGKISPEYKAHQELIQRCLNPCNKNYSDYGGRGISVCARWLGPEGFANFLADMGEKPEPKHSYSIDRFPNNNGNYEPSNCRWATWSQQANNKRKQKSAKPSPIQMPPRKKEEVA